MCFHHFIIDGFLSQDTHHHHPRDIVQKGPFGSCGEGGARLVVEIFGVWTPFALKTLQNIADHTIPRSGVPRKVARRNLLQQLSVPTMLR